MIIEHQDTEIIIINPYTWEGEPDGIYFKIESPMWCGSIVGNDYRVMLKRHNYNLIQIENDFYTSRYQAIETSLTGDVLILGMGLATLDQFLITGSSWKWVEINDWLVANVVPANGTVHQGDANDITFLETLGTFDTILIDFPRTDIRVDYTPILNVAANVIEMKL